ncbi:TIGR03086 family protein [Streptomyces sp. AV19]|uniref:TIGR03086 family metal-binding protein n=1 Tax=Streptomyces sp. AV19 TaxID=2793068 RepID=UPI0018FEA3E7|nr:TIGR03086 family metal-binding protein [Streptomyces sp. AV19]MBH1933865.1 TIGR03086 family protein [Streptomyces sp. AV19]MDG4535647.1 TIGR03086 family metal-binding protein [Streptomyces sp. AV19]
MTDARTVTDPRPQLRRAVEQLNTLVASVRTERLGEPTPCGDFDVRALLRHLLGAWTKFAEGAATAGFKPGPPTGLPEVADDAWAEVLAGAGARLVAEWDDEARLAAPFDAPWGSSPGYGAVAFFVLETVTHAWDLNETLGRPVGLDPELSAFALATAEAAIPAEGRPGAFEPARPAPEGADVHTRLAARTGRDVK